MTEVAVRTMSFTKNVKPHPLSLFLTADQSWSEVTVTATLSDSEFYKPGNASDTQHMVDAPAQGPIWSLSSTDSS